MSLKLVRPSFITARGEILKEAEKLIMYCRVTAQDVLNVKLSPPIALKKEQLYRLIDGYKEQIIGISFSCDAYIGEHYVQSKKTVMFFESSNYDHVQDNALNKRYPVTKRNMLTGNRLPYIRFINEQFKETYDSLDLINSYVVLMTKLISDTMVQDGFSVDLAIVHQADGSSTEGLSFRKKFGNEWKTFVMSIRDTEIINENIEEEAA